MYDNTMHFDCCSVQKVEFFLTRLAWRVCMCMSVRVCVCGDDIIDFCIDISQPVVFAWQKKNIFFDMLNSHRRRAL